MNTDFDLQNVGLTLRYGYFNGENPKKLFVAFAFFASVGFFGVILGVVMTTIQQINDPSPIGSFICTLMVFVIGIPIIPVILFLLLYRNHKIRKEIEKWLEDAILLDAFIQEIDRMRDAGWLLLIKFQVDFDIDGVHFVRTSEEEKQLPFSYKHTKGYFPDVLNYMGKKVKILYSQKYDQVMILKNN